MCNVFFYKKIFEIYGSVLFRISFFNFIWTVYLQQLNYKLISSSYRLYAVSNQNEARYECLKITYRSYPLQNSTSTFQLCKQNRSSTEHSFLFQLFWSFFKWKRVKTSVNYFTDLRHFSTYFRLEFDSEPKHVFFCIFISGIAFSLM